MSSEDNCKGKLASEDVLIKKNSIMNPSVRSCSVDSDENVRHTWSKKTEYLLSIIGYCVGLGNIWRFPYVCMRNGGGAFLIPFLLSLFACALPVFFLEVAMGQFIGKSAWHVWCICPLFKGIGISMNILSAIVTWYYSTILGWCLIYLVNSFKSPLPWTLCGQTWNTKDCMTVESYRAINSTLLNTTLLNSTSPLNSTLLNSTYLLNSTWLLGNGIENNGTDDLNSSMLADSNRTSISSVEEFWLHNVLEITKGMEDLGGLPWHTTLSLVVSNLVVLIAVIKGIQSSGKVVYVTATLPYLLLLIMLIVGCTLPGSGDGILFYISPDFSKLLNYKTWVEASIQVFYSLGPGWGGIVTMASYNKFNNNCMRDSILLTICCEGTSIFGGFAIFSILGHMAYRARVPIMDFAKSGAGLAFIVYPEAVTYMPLPQLWGFLFFLMIFTIGLDSQFTNVEVIITTLADVWPKFVSRWRKTIAIVIMCAFTLFGTLFATRGGIYWFQLTDWYIAAFTLLIQAAIECVIIAWIYGADRFSGDIELMIGRKPPKIFVWAWKFISPSLLMVIFVLTLVFYKPPSYEGYTYPAYAEYIGWFIAILPFMSIIGYAVIVILRTKGSLAQRLRTSLTATEEWAPSLPEVREKYPCGYSSRPEMPEALPLSKNVCSNV